MRKLILLIAGAICVVYLLGAETKTFIRDYTYDASEADSKITCRTMALEQVKRALLEELGTYLISHTEVENYMLKKDEIICMTAGVAKTVILEEKWNGEQYYLKAKIDADPEDVVKQIGAMRNDRNRTNELEEVKKTADAALLEIERLRNELSTLKSEKEKITAQENYARVAGRIRSSDMMRDAYDLYLAGKFQDAIDVYTQILQLDPNNYFAFHNRGICYAEMGDRDTAIRDLNDSIRVNPNYGHAYFTRGFIYTEAGDDRNAFRNYLKAAEVDPDHEMAQYNLGVMYAQTGEERKSVEHFKISARLGFHLAQEYLRKKGISW